MSGPSARPLRILCVDDSRLLAESLQRRLEHEPSFVWLGWVDRPEAAESAAMTLSPDIMLMDVDMPGVDTFALVEHLSLTYPDVRIVMFSGHAQPAFVERAFDCGAWGYLSKNDDTAALIDGIRRVGAGAVVLSNDVKLS